MNPLTNVRNITKLNEREISLGIDQKNSWHNMYKDSAWIFIGGLNFDLSEGDIIAVFSQYGEIVNINLVRDTDSGKSKGFCFLCYRDQRSTILAVDNFNGIKLLNRVIRVDHVANYRLPKIKDDTDSITKQLYDEGCAPKPVSNDRTKQVIEININIKKEKDTQDNKDSKRKHSRHSHSRSEKSSRDKKSKKF